MMGIWSQNLCPMKKFAMNQLCKIHNIFVLLWTAIQTASLCTFNPAVISDWVSLWQLFGQKRKTSDKLHKDMIFGKRDFFGN